MYNQGHQQGHNSRLNGNPAGRGMPLLYNFAQSTPHQHQGHNQHHQNLQQDPNSHSGASSSIGHHAGYSGGVLSNTSPYTNSLQNGMTGATRGGQAQAINEHWAEQLRVHKEAMDANTAMVEHGEANYYARVKAAENKGIAGPAPASATSNSVDDTENRNRPWSIEKSPKRQDWLNLDISGQGIKSLSISLFDVYKFLNELYVGSNKLSSLPPAIGELRQLRHLDVSHNNLVELPPELGMCTFLKQLLLFNNHIRTLPCELGSLHHLEMLGIEGNPLNHEMKREIIERGTKSLITYLREQSPVPLPPVPRKVVTVQEDVSPALERVKVFSWNILCERYATPQMYGYTPSEALAWDYRKDLILQEIRSRDADFVCLQELNNDALKSFFGPELAKMDYKHIWWPKPRAKTMAEKDAAMVDGCAIFWKGAKYICLDRHLIECNSLAINRPDMKTQGVDIFNRVMPKDNIAVMGFFESRQTGARMVVVNAHLAWDANMADVKIIQTAIIMEQVTKFADKYSRWPPCKDKKLIEFSHSAADGEEEVPKPAMPEPAPSQEYRNNTDIPLFVCGDYNSTTGSGVCELLSTGHLAPDHPELAQYQYGNFTRDGIEHPFNLRSSYQHLLGTPDDLPFTNYTPGFAEVIDYIWYSTNTLEVVSVLGAPDSQYLKRVPGFPNYHFPADHIQIMSEFVIKARKDKKGGA